MNKRLFAALALAALAAGPAPLPPAPPVDLSRQPTLYSVGYAHLDTQWRWSYPQVVNQFLANTLKQNFPLLDKYPHYVFNFTGSRRYQLMKEFFPDDYARMKTYIKAGRWFPGGSNVDETDQNVPSAESVVRHVLYGNQFFRREFGVCGTDFMVPDCFGFPYSLPSVLHHCSIQGFNTQKLAWGSAVGIPFNVGVWRGVDGESVLAALNPGPYDSHVIDDLSHDPHWVQRVGDDAKRTGVAADYRYYGTGDRGGAPAEQSVANMETSVTGTGPLRVVPATSDQFFKDVTPEQRAKLPVYDGDLLLTWHSSGSVTSQAWMKRMNRRNELLADAAERAGVAAAWLGATPYPGKKLYDSWMLLLEAQMHDILPGDCLPKCYEYSWNDEVLAANGFAAAETDGVGGVAASMDTTGEGVPLVVYNPLGAERTDVVEATVQLPAGARDVTVTGPDGKDCPSQIIGADGGKTKILFVAKVPGTSFATFAVKLAGTYAIDGDLAVGRPAPALKVTANAVENERYRVTVNPAGDVAQVFDKLNGRNLLTAPLRLGFLHQNPEQFPAWNMDWDDRRQPCQQFVGGPATIKIVESGRVRVALEITRETRGSRFVQRVQLTAGGDRVEFPTHIDWQSTECSLEAVMPLAVAAPTATYDTQVGVTVRANNNPKKYEVPQQQWLDVTNPDGSYGVSVLNDCKYGSDKPDDATVRLTLLHTPGVRGGYQDEASQDWGKHELTYALSGHTGTWAAADTVESAARLNQPLVAFQTVPHAGPLGRQFQLVSVSDPAVSVQAIKKAEESDELVVRLKETRKRTATGVTLTFAAPVLSAREVDGQEQPLGPAVVADGKLVTDVKPFHLKAFAVKLAPPSTPAATVAATPLPLPFDLDVVSTHANLHDGAFDGDGRTYPAEQLPAALTCDGVPFHLGPTADGQNNAVACHGQSVPLPAGTTRVYLLAAAANGDAAVSFRAGDRDVPVTVQDWGGSIGCWDNRHWKGTVSALTYNWGNRLDGLVPGYTKRDEVAWYADHRHHPANGNEVWEYCYLFKYAVDVPSGATTLTLPDNAKVRVFAATAATAGAHDAVTPARPLYDTLADHVVDSGPRLSVSTTATSGVAEPYADSVHVTVDRPLYWRGTDGLRYTTDGSDPSAASPLYETPLFVAEPTTIKARQFDGDRPAGPVLSQRVDVHDTTPPAVLEASAMLTGPQVSVSFSEPVIRGSAEAVGNYRLDPPVAVTSAQLQADGSTVLLDLAGPAGGKLSVSGVRDTSPAGNVVRPATVPVASVRPLFRLDAYTTADGAAPLTRHVAGLPTKASDPWTINAFVRPDRAVDALIPIVGFGRCKDDRAGAGRYLCKFDDGLRYWSREQDVGSTTPLDVGRWQMVTATWDGHTLTLFKDGKVIGTGQPTLADDADLTVRVAPLSPWDNHSRFSGELRDVTIWPAALPPRTVQSMSLVQQHD